MTVENLIKVRCKNLIRRITDWSLKIRPYWVELGSGYQVAIDSLVTLSLFEEIFVEQVYSSPFDILDQIDFIVDLGANRGLFMVYAFHKYKVKGGANPLKIVCVEPVKENFQSLLQQIEVNNLSPNVKPVNGVVTNQRSGQVLFSYYSRHHVTGSILSRKVGKKFPVDIVDLAQHVGDQWIDILKVDIEGSEQDFLFEYADILMKTKVLIIEFHRDLVDQKVCQAIITDSGFSYYGTYGDLTSTTVVETYFRPVK